MVYVWAAVICFLTQLVPMFAVEQEWEPACDLQADQATDCSYAATTEKECVEKGCCWKFEEQYCIGGNINRTQWPETMQIFPFAYTVIIVWPPAEDIIFYVFGVGKHLPVKVSMAVLPEHGQYGIGQLNQSSEYVLGMRPLTSNGLGPFAYKFFKTKAESEARLIPVRDLQAEVLSPNSVSIKWIDVQPDHVFHKNNLYYRVRYSAVGSGQVHYVNSTSESVIMDNLLPGTEYKFAVQVVKGQRQSGWESVRTKT